MTSPGGDEVGRVSIRVLPDTSKFQRSLQRYLERTEQRMRLQIPVSLDTAGASAEMQALTQRLESNEIDIPVNVNRGILDRLTGSLARVQNGSGGARRGMSRLGRTLTIVGAVAGLAAPAIGAVGTAILGIPGAIAGVATPIATMALGMEGLKRAAEQAKPAFDNLRNSLAQTLETGFVPVFQQIGNTLLPGITDSLNGMASTMANLAQKFTDVITSASGMETINAVISNIDQAFANLAPSVEPLTRGMMTLAEVGSDALTRFAGVINRFSADFNEMVQRLASSGTLASAFDGLSAVVEPVLNLFVRLLDVGAQVMARMGPQLGETFSVLGDLIIAMLPALEQLTNIFIAILLPTMRALIPVFEALTPVLELVADALTAMSPVIGPVAVGFLGIFSAVKMLSPLVTLMAKGFKLLGPVIKGASKAFTVLNIAMRANPIGFIITLIAGLVAAVIWAWNNVDWFREGIITAWNAIRDAAMWLWQNALQPFFSWIATMAVQIGNWFVNMGQTISNTWTNVTAWIRNAWTNIKNTVSNGVNAVTSFVGSLPGRIRGFFANAWNWLVSAGRDIVNGLLNGLRGAWSTVVGWITGAAGNLIDSVKGMFGIASPSKVFEQIGQFTAEGLERGIRGGSPGAVREAERMARRASQGAQGRWNGTLRSEAYGNMTANVAAALQGMEWTLDERGGKVMSRVTEKANRRNARR